MEITEVTPINPLTENDKQSRYSLHLEEVPLGQVEVPQVLLDVVNEPLKVSWLDYYITIKYGVKMKDWKTTLSGALGGAVVIAKLFGMEIPAEVVTGVVAISGFLVGLFSRDSASKPEAKE